MLVRRPKVNGATTNGDVAKVNGAKTNGGIAKVYGAKTNGSVAMTKSRENGLPSAE